MATPTTLPATFVAGNVLTAAQMNNLRGAFRVLQVVSSTKTDTYTMSSATFTDVTGLTASITPSSTSSKILVIASLTGTGQVATTGGHIRLARGGTGIAVGDAAGNRIQDTAYFDASDRPKTVILEFLDSPSSTSSVTYSVQVRNEGSGTVYVNRSQSDTDNAIFMRTTSTITVMEISA